MTRLPSQYRVTSIDPEQIELVTLRNVLALWREARGSRPAPLRSELGPEQLKSVLPDILVLERTSAGNLRIRLAGTGTYKLYNRDLTGKDIGALSPRGLADQLQTGLMSVLETGKPCCLVIDIPVEALRIHWLSLPMMSVPGFIDQALVVQYIEGDAVASGIFSDLSDE